MEDDDEIYMGSDGHIDRELKGIPYVHVCPPNPPICKCRPIWLVYGAIALVVWILWCWDAPVQRVGPDPKAVQEVP